MVSLPEALVEGMKSAYCSLYGDPLQWAANNFSGPAGYLGDKARAARRWVCGEDPDADEPVPVPFEGGQCSGVRYRVFVITRRFDGVGCSDSPETNFGNYFGPIGAPYAVPSVPPSAPGNTWFFTANGTPVSIGFLGTVPCSDAAVVGFRVQRVDGLPDNCGDPPPVLPPPAPVNIDINIEYGDNNEFSLTVPVVFAPVYVAIDGSLNIPVSFTLAPNFELNGTLELFPDFELNVGVPVEDDPGETQPDPTPPPESPDGDGTEGEEDPDVPEDPRPRVYGLLCRARIESEARPSGIFQEIGPDIYVPRLGSARFGTTIDGVTFWSEDIDIKGLNSVIQCPIPWGATRYAVNAAPGVVVNFTAISSAPKDWPPFLQLGDTFTSDERS